jgi:hypothetical protein
MTQVRRAVYARLVRAGRPRYKRAISPSRADDRDLIG